MSLKQLSFFKVLKQGLRIPHKLTIPVFILTAFYLDSVAQVDVTVDFKAEGRTYSPYIFGKNNSLSGKPDSPLLEAEWVKLQDSGITIFRENGGNNSTKYNWRKKLSSHPDWYNNVYPTSWDFKAQSLAEKFPDRMGIFGLQLLGMAASTNTYNFNEWEFNQAQWWEGVHQNLAGGGVVNSLGGGDALVEGNPDLYLTDWPADSTVGIFDHWFDEDRLALNMAQFQYWCMDNEPSIWNGTHDDVAGDEETAEEYMQKYFKVAKAARTRFPEVKLIGPIVANEWQWYSWHNQRISYKGKTYAFLEYFILRIGEEQKASGIRLLDVLAIHFYPTNQEVSKVVQFHRIFFDENYAYPDANGVKTIDGGWDPSINKEYIFKRALDWMEEYIGPDHNVGLGITETGVEINDQNGVAVWYASHLGEFMKHNVEVFTPWSWQPAMWEVVNLFTEFSHELFFDAVSENELLISAYTTSDETKGTVTSILVNRSTTTSQEVNLNIEGIFIDKKSVKVHVLSGLDSDETFVSDSENALKEVAFSAGHSAVTIDLAPLSVAAVTLQTIDSVITGFDTGRERGTLRMYPNPNSGRVLNIQTDASVLTRFRLLSTSGRILKHLEQPDSAIDLKGIQDGIYVVQIDTNSESYWGKLILR